MLKNFDEWNKRKKKIDSETMRQLFRPGEIWWAHVGDNIGVEASGKGKYFLRPVVILRKYNDSSFLALPLTSSPIQDNFRIPVGIILGREAVVNASQLKYMDSKRLHKPITQMDQIAFSELMKKADEINFHPPFSL